MHIRIIEPQSPEDKENIYRFLYTVWAEEFHRTMEGMDHEKQRIKDTLDDTASHFMAVDHTGRILGCIRSNILAQCQLPHQLQAPLAIDEITSFTSQQRVAYVSRFAVDPAARGKTVASLLIAAVFRHGIDQGMELGLSYCALHLVNIYYQLGFRPYTKNFRVDAGLRMPIVLCLNDYAYLNKIRSPLLRLCPAKNSDQGKMAALMKQHFPFFEEAPSFSRHKIHHLWAFIAHTNQLQAEESPNGLLNDLSPEEWEILGKRLSLIHFSQDEYIYHRGETEQSMGILVEGRLGVEISVNGMSRVITILSPGQPFGEICCLAQGHRTTDLVALERVTAMLIPVDFFDRIARKDQTLGLKLSQRLLGLVAKRFVEFSDCLTSLDTGVSSGVSIQRPVLCQRPDPENLDNRIESYRFDRLGDRQQEFKRLVTQASIGEELEFSTLNRIGLRDGATIFDLGSGPGITSMLMAKRLPAATIIGLEPEDLLRTQAETLIASQQLATRCTFIKGTGAQIPLADNTVDFCYARLVFQHLPNPVAVLKELNRITRHGGIVAVMDVDDRTTMVHPEPTGLNTLEGKIAAAQQQNGGDRYVGRKLPSYFTQAGIQQVEVEPIPITASLLGRENYYSIVYNFKRQVLARIGALDEQAEEIFHNLRILIQHQNAFAMTTLFAVHGLAL